ncbi:C_GCAxxG_C_C family protein [bacterium]|nr:C_GCAxxG_C_C family protein [bacterium]
MMKAELIERRVEAYFRDDDETCAVTILKILSELFETHLDGQVFAAATGMHGAGEYGAQCGLLEGMLMFLGIYGHTNGIPEEYIIQSCREYAGLFDKEFGSLLCSVLRPEGFAADNPPHICEPLTKRAVLHAAEYLESVRDVFV